MFEAILLGQSRAQRSALSAVERDEVDRLIGLIELDPWIDGVHKFSMVFEPIVLTVYDNRLWQIAYRVVDNRFVETYGIRRLK
ncbi:MAG: hypothetical protein AB7R89_34430 [Dehalococcoidia bacterium]